MGRADLDICCHLLTKGEGAVLAVLAVLAILAALAVLSQLAVLAEHITLRGQIH